MATDVKIPPLGESIASGIIAAWHVEDGAVVSQGQALFDLETDKITSEATAEVSGQIKILAEEGQEVEIGAVVATIDDSVSAPASAATDSTAAPTAAPAADGPPNAKLSPAVARIAAQSGIDPASVPGSGKQGRVTKGDMLAAAATKPASQAPAPASAPEAAPQAASAPLPAAASERTTRRKMTPLRKTIAKRLVDAQQSTAMLTTFNEVDMSAVIRLRKQHQEAFVAKHGIKLGFMSFFTKAVVHALQAVPAVNARIDGEHIVENHFYDVSIAVSTPKGLTVPVIRDCDQKSFADIEHAIIAAANKAKEGKLTMDDLQGGVFSITNGGIFGSMLSTPILNTPQAAILGMHTISERPVALNGEVVIRPMMFLALSYDHRLIDGREAVTFLVAVKNAIEDPARLLLNV